MTDRIDRLTVVLERDMRDDDCVALISAIRMMRNVLSVEAHVTDAQDLMAQQRARHELGQKLLDIVYPKSGNYALDIEARPSYTGKDRAADHGEVRHGE